MPQPLTALLAPDWAEALKPVEPTVHQLGDFLRRENTAGHGFLPPASLILNAFTRPLANVRVLIVGQDPYPTPGHPIGLSFSVGRDTRPIPRSLQNIYKELEADLGIPAPTHGDLSAWADQGVMLLNRVLTVRPGLPGSHRGKGWETVTDHAIHTLVQRGGPLVTVLWGRDAQNLTPMLGNTARIVSAHPSPLSASRGFYGSRPFSTINRMLESQGAQPIDWQVP